MALNHVFAWLQLLLLGAHLCHAMDKRWLNGNLSNNLVNPGS